MTPEKTPEKTFGEMSEKTPGDIFVCALRGPAAGRGPLLVWSQDDPPLSGRGPSPLRRHARAQRPAAGPAVPVRLPVRAAGGAIVEKDYNAAVCVPRILAAMKDAVRRR